MRSYGIVPPGTAVPYRHRDPAWVTAADLAGLKAADDRRKLLERYVPDPTRSPAQQEAARLARIRRFTRLRAAGYSVTRAAAEMRIARSTARGYERARKQLTGGTA